MPSATAPFDPTAEGRTVISDGTINLIVPGVDWTGLTTNQLSANTIRYMPFLVRRKITVDTLYAEVTSPGSGGTTFRVGIYNATTGWQPSSLVLDAGTAAADSATVKTIAVNLTLPRGRYLIAINSDGTPTMRMMRGGSLYLGVLQAMGAVPYMMYGSVSAAYSTFASTGVPWNAAVAGGAGGLYPVVMRVSVP